MIYLNHQHQPVVDSEIKEMIFDFFQTLNSSEIEKRYLGLKELLNIDSNESLVITHSDAEAINEVIFGVYLEVTRKTGKNHFITTHLEGASTIQSFARLEQLGCVTKIVNACSKGYITLDAIKESITPRTAFLSISIANGLTGVIQPIDEIAEVCKERGIFLHINASPAVSCMDCSLSQLKADAITFDGMKLHSPISFGAILYAEKKALKSFILGQTIQPFLILAFEETLRRMVNSYDYLGTEISYLKNLFETQIKNKIPSVEILFQDESRLPYVSCIGFPKVMSEPLLFLMHQKKLEATAGGGSQPTLEVVLESSEIPSELRKGAVSFSFNRFTTENEINTAISIIESGYSRLLTYSQGVFA